MSVCKCFCVHGLVKFILQMLILPSFSFCFSLFLFHRELSTFINLLKSYMGSGILGR
jgi:hypothetical protein